MRNKIKARTFHAMVKTSFKLLHSFASIFRFQYSILPSNIFYVILSATFVTCTTHVVVTHIVSWFVHRSSLILATCPAQYYFSFNESIRTVWVWYGTVWVLCSIYQKIKILNKNSTFNSKYRSINNMQV